MEIKGWFDRSLKHFLPIGSIGTIFKIEKLDEEINNIIYSVQFEDEFGYVNIKHSDLQLI